MSEGYCVVPGFLDDCRVAELQGIAAIARSRPAADSFSRDAYSGHVSELSELPELATALLWPEPFQLLREMGFGDPRWFMAFMIQKAPGTMRLYWHQDWWGWSDPISYRREPPLLFFMYYLADVSRANGCLRVLPGTHVSPHPLHAQSALTDYMGFDGGAEHPLLARQEGEIDVAVARGDLIIRDSRLLHATHANATDGWRPLLSLSIAPDLSGLPQQMQRTMEIKRPKLEKCWPAETWRKVRRHLSVGPEKGLALPLVRKPDFSLGGPLS